MTGRSSATGRVELLQGGNIKVRLPGCRTVTMSRDDARLLAVELADADAEKEECLARACAVQLGLSELDLMAVCPHCDPDCEADDLTRYVAEQEATDPEFKTARRHIAERHRLLDSLVNVRKRKKLTQQQVADRLGISQPSVAEFEGEASDPKLSTLQRYARAVGMRLVVLVAAAPVDGAE